MKHRVAFVGAGWIADWYYQAYQRLHDSFELVGCCGNPSAEGQRRLRVACDKMGVKAFPSLEDVLADRSIDCVVILSPTSLHYEQASAALRAGKHVLVEKPVALDERELDELAVVAKDSGRVLFPGHNFVYRPVVRKAKEILYSGKLGVVSYASFRAAHFIPPEHAAGWRKEFASSGGGAMMDSGTHLVYQSLYLFGMPRWLSCFSATKHYIEMDGEDVCQISLQYSDGMIGQIFQSWGSADGSAGELRIEGDKGVLLITDALYLDGDKIEDDSSYPSSFYHTLASFGLAADGMSSMVSSVEEAKRTLRIIQAAYRAAKSRTVVSL
jgi:Predicted dehydrogenases and related proteins